MWLSIDGDPSKASSSSKLEGGKEQSSFLDFFEEGPWLLSGLLRLGFDIVASFAYSIVTRHVASIKGPGFEATRHVVQPDQDLCY